MRSIRFRHAGLGNGSPFLSGLVLAAAAALLAAAAGCSQPSTGAPTPQAGQTPPEQATVSVKVVHPERATLHRTVRQPGYVQAFEQTPVFAQVAGYLRKWHVDIDVP